MAETKQVIELKRRSCSIGNSINNRREKHGEDAVPAADISIVGFMLTAEELEAMTTKYAREALFNTRLQTGAKEPMFHGIYEPFEMIERFEASCTINLGRNGKDKQFDDIHVKSIVHIPMSGGLTEMRCTLQINEDMHKHIGDLVQRYTKPIELELSIGEKVARKKDKRQNELPMDHDADEDAD